MTAGSYRFLSIPAKSYTMSLTSLDGQNDDETKHLPDVDMRNMS